MEISSTLDVCTSTCTPGRNASAVAAAVLNFNYLSGTRANCSNSGSSFRKKRRPFRLSSWRTGRQAERNAAGRRCTHPRAAEARTNASRQTRVLGSRHQATLRRENQDRRGREGCVCILTRPGIPGVFNAPRFLVAEYVH